MRLLKTYKWLIIMVMAVAIGVSLVLSLTKPAYYDTSLSFSINRVNKQETEAYQYDGYYAIQASDLFSQTVMSWFMTPSVLLEIYNQAGIDPKISSIENFISRFKTKQYSPQNIVVRFKERDQQTAEKISTAIVATIEQAAKESNQTTDQKALFEVVGAKPVIVKRLPVLWLNLLISFIAGLVLSFVVIYLAEYFKKDNSQQLDQGH